MPRPIVRLLVALAALVLVAAACGGDDAAGDEASADTAADTTTSTPTEDPATTPVEAQDWEEHVPGGDCQCGDGADFRFYSRVADPEKVMLFFQGGGACFSLATCNPDDPSYTTVATGLQPESGSGVFDVENPDNPFRDWSMVFVPYCTGDVHLGDNTNTYGPGVTVNHKGYVNGKAAFDYMVEAFPDATEVFVTGSSAGGVPSPLFGGLASDAYPDADIAVLADASGVYADNPAVNVAIGNLWGAFNNTPDWPEIEGQQPEDFSIPGLFVNSGLHDPDIRFARYDNAYDEVQQSFSSLAGLSNGDLLDIIQANEAFIEDAGVPVASYIAPGTDHTILGYDGMYDLEVDGVSFLDWLNGFVAGEETPDVACTDCENPADA